MFSVDGKTLTHHFECHAFVSSELALLHLINACNELHLSYIIKDKSRLIYGLVVKLVELEKVFSHKLMGKHSCISVSVFSAATSVIVI